MKRLAAALTASALAMGLSQSVYAEQISHTWRFDSDSIAGIGSGGYAKDATDPFNYDSDKGLNTTVSGWYDDGTTLANGNDYLRHWSGLSFDQPGESAPWHGVDNKGPDEILVFEFDEAISLQSFKFGYAKEYTGSSYKSQADATVLYRNEADANATGTGNLDASSMSGLTAMGYSVLGHFGDVASNVNKDISSLTQGITSKVWAIGAYIGALGGSGTKYGSVGTGWKDAFKLHSIAGVSTTPDDTPGEVPTPATLALLGLGGLLLRSRRSR